MPGSPPACAARGLDRVGPLGDNFFGCHGQERITHRTGIAAEGIAHEFRTADLQIPHASRRLVGAEFGAERFDCLTRRPLWRREPSYTAQHRAKPLRLHWGDEAETQHEPGDRDQHSTQGRGPLPLVCSLVHRLANALAALRHL